MFVVQVINIKDFFFEIRDFFDFLEILRGVNDNAFWVNFQEVIKIENCEFF